MADEENATQQIAGRRSTRSGRKPAVTTPPTPSKRNTRRSSRKAQPDSESEEQVHDTMPEIMAHDEEEGDKKISMVVLEDIQESKVMQLSDIIQEEEELEEEDTEVIQNEITDLTEETDLESEANVVQLDDFIQESEVIDEPLSKLGSSDLGQDSYVETEIIAEVEDEKSSSFPFGDMPSEITSSQHEQSVEKDDVDNSFFANLAAEENANSLPSAAEDVPDESREDMEDADKDEMLEDPQGSIDAADIVISNKPEIVSEDVEMGDVSESLPVDDIAIVEDLPNGDNSNDTRPEPDTEMVSDDELPTPAKPKVQDTEEVSDDELPEPKLAELPADTEVVSEDELPSSNKKTNLSEEGKSTELPADTEAVSDDELPISNKKSPMKRKATEDSYDPCSPTDGSRPEKKAKTNESSDDKENADGESEKKKRLPELDNYWKAIGEDPGDFTGWTHLLQYVDQENDIEAAREAYDAFLASYPYCYGYWRKYADYEKKKGDKKKCEEVFERGLKAIPLSVDLWIHFLAHVKANYTDDEPFIRTQFERAIDACGLEFRSDKLWEAYIKWETEGKRLSKVLGIYDRLLATPTQGYNSHFDSFQELVNNNIIASLIPVEEIKKLRDEVRESLDTPEKVVTDEAIPPGADEPDDHLRNEEEIRAVKDKILSARRKIHKATIAAVTERWTYEEGIKRPYFHVKALEWCQLKNWKDYIDFEIEKGDRKRVLVLFERCLIACALYDEFWLKLIRYLESQNTDGDLETVTRDVYIRACKSHHPEKPSLHLMWSAFEELHNNFDTAAEILVNIEKKCPNLLQIAYRRINVERRRKDYDKCLELYEHYTTNAKNKNIASSLAIKYARFLHKIKTNLEGGLTVLKSALEKDPGNARLVLQMIDLVLQRSEVDENEVVTIMDNFMNRDGIEPDQKVLFAQRKVEFLEDFGSSVKGLQDAQRTLQVSLSKANDLKKKQSESSSTKKSKDSAAQSTNSSAAATSSYSNAYAYGSSGQTPSNYYYGGSQSAGASGGYQGGYGDYSSNSWSQYPQSGYSGYQWGGYEYYNI